MSPADLLRVKDLFLTASELPREQRLVWLNEQEASDEVRCRVVRQLERLDSGSDDLLVAPHNLAQELEPTDIGPFRVVERIGEGGMGVVYRAEQVEPVQRQVAVKRIKPGMDSRAVLTRFENERRALSCMDHPNIARVLDAGTDEVGRPYFAMELVEGVSITEYCDREQLDPEARLALFISVCRGVEHAHQRGVLHRDLKPGNVLVAEVDGVPVPKIIDFGVAKAIQQRLTERTLITQLGLVVGTPEYMSPEQADPSVADVDTRSDVYSLGVILYELLSGEVPFGSEYLRAAGFAGILRVLQEEDPQRPSTRVSTVSEAAAERAQARRLDVRGLSQRLRGDLDWITMRALRKAPDRRYPSAGAFAADVERHLRFEPVLAGPPTLRYQCSKYIRRHRTQVAAVLLIVLSLVVGAAVALWFAFDAREQAEDARNARLVADEKATEARVQRDGAQRVLQFLTDALGFLGPDVAEDQNITVRGFLDRVAASATNELSKEPKVEAAVLTAVGAARWTRGELGAAKRHLRRALELREADPTTTAMQLHDVFWPYGWVTWQTGDLRYESLWRCAVENARKVVCGAAPAADRFMRELRSWAQAGVKFELAEPERTLHQLLRTAAQSVPRGDRRWIALADYLVACVEWAARDGKDAALCEALFSSAMQSYTEHAGLSPAHTRIGLARETMLYAWYGAGDFRRGEAVAREALNLLGYMHAAAGTQRDLVPLAADRMRELLRGGAPVGQLCHCAKLIVRVPNVDREQLGLAMQGIRAALDQESENSACHEVLGIAEYRLGNYDRCLVALVESGRLSNAANRPMSAVNLLFVAMAKSSLGRQADARKALSDAVRLLGQDPAPEASAFLAEAKELVEPGV